MEAREKGSLVRIVSGLLTAGWYLGWVALAGIVAGTVALMLSQGGGEAAQL